MIDYIKAKKLYLLVCLVIIVVFNINLALYQLNTEIVLYGNLLSIFIISIFFIYDYIKYTKHLADVRNNYHSIEYDGKLIAYDKIEKEYQDTIDKLKNNIKTQEELNDLKTASMIEYYTMWVHQIKTPIAAMKLILEDENNIDLSIELLKIEQYVQMVLSYLRLNSESSDYVFRMVDLNEIIKENIKANSIIFIKKKIQIDYQEIDYKFVSDDKWLSFAIGQIISNALKYTKNGGKIEISFKDNILSIKDNGIGISEHDLPRIFEKGYSGYQGREDKKATGIGLYLTKTILDRLNHPIWIDSKVGYGTTVFIDLKRNNTIFD